MESDREGLCLVSELNRWWACCVGAEDFDSFEELAVTEDEKAEDLARDWNFLQAGILRGNWDIPCGGREGDNLDTGFTEAEVGCASARHCSYVSLRVTLQKVLIELQEK